MYRYLFFCENPGFPLKKIGRIGLIRPKWGIEEGDKFLRRGTRKGKRKGEKGRRKGNKPKLGRERAPQREQVRKKVSWGARERAP